MIEVAALPRPRRPQSSAPDPADGPTSWARGALIASAQAFLAEGRRAASVTEIVDRAHVDLSAFYRNFSSRAHLYRVAVVSTMLAFCELRDELVAGIEDPAEAFAASCRLTGRLQRRMPEQVRVLLNTGTNLLFHDDGLASRARHDLTAAVEQGRLDLDDIELAVAMAGGALLGLMQRLDSDEGLDDAEVCDEFTERLLHAFGMDAAAAHELCRRPLPELPAVL